MDKVKTSTETEDQLNMSRLTYLSETLANALEDMEFSQKALQEFSIQNSLTAQESFLTVLLLEDLEQPKEEKKFFPVRNFREISRQ